MEKSTGESGNKITRIVLTGPECTGKSTLAAELATHYNTVYIPEYAREYISGLSRPYTLNDVQHIAEIQIRQKEEFSALDSVRASGILFMDTYLIITKVWFELVYHQCPGWITSELARNDIDLYLLCNTDIPWVPDPVRENGGSKREYLLKLYKKELINYACNYRIVYGTGMARLQNAISHVEHFIHNDNGVSSIN